MNKGFLIFILVIGISIILDSYFNNIISTGLLDLFNFILYGITKRNTVKFNRRLKKERIKTSKKNKGFLYIVLTAIIADMGYSGVTIEGLLSGLVIITAFIDVGIYLFSRSLFLCLFSFIPILTVLISILFLISRINHDYRLDCIMDAEDAICPLIENNGVLGAIKLALQNNAIKPIIRQSFIDFVTRVEIQNLPFEVAIAMLNSELGEKFNEFATKSVQFYYNRKVGSGEMFMDIVEGNARLRRLNTIKRQKFGAMMQDYVAALSVVVFFFVSSLSMEAFRSFFFNTGFGKGSLVVVFIIICLLFTAMQYLQAKFDSETYTN